jgi:hypothetical protein
MDNEKLLPSRKAKSFLANTLTPARLMSMNALESTIEEGLMSSVFIGALELPAIPRLSCAKELFRKMNTRSAESVTFILKVELCTC